jgi:spermidine/putrescine transport system substrate-binding protein
MMDYDQAKQNTEYVGYSTPRKDVFEEMIAPGGSFEDYQSSYDVRINDNDEVYRYNEDLKQQMDAKWQEILANKGFDQDEGLGTSTLIAIIGVGLLVVTSAVLGVIKKKKNQI